MEDKLGTELNISLNTPEEIRKKSKELNAGYDENTKEWSLIIKYIGNFESLMMDYDSVGVPLLANFATIRISEEKIIDFASDNRVIYVEKPKLFNQERTTINGFTASCMINPYFDLKLQGKGVMVAIIDSGVDIFHPEFIINENGNKRGRIVGLWDQTLYGNPPDGYNVGTFYNDEDINNAINQELDFMSLDVSGHGTAVAGIVAACTPASDLLIVKLDSSSSEQVDTIYLMQGIDFVIRYSRDNNIPMVINLSYGNNSGDHNGNSVLERYIDEVSLLGKLTFVIGVGNDGVAGRHTMLIMGNESFYKKDFVIPEGEEGINIQIWRELQDQVDIFLSTPLGKTIGPFNNYNNIMSYDIDDMVINVLNSGASPINTRQETYISIISKKDFIENGTWSLFFNPKSIINGRVDIWLPVEGSTNTDIYFLDPVETTTITIPSTAKNVISVGAYDSNSMSLSSFSGRGYTLDGLIKPDLVAPGENIDVPFVGGGFRFVSGTSFATPFVASAAVMLMEYGIVNNNDPFLYGNKVKAYLTAGAKLLPNQNSRPNPLTGWGYLCVENSIPKTSEDM